MQSLHTVLKNAISLWKLIFDAHVSYNTSKQRHNPWIIRSKLKITGQHEVSYNSRSSVDHEPMQSPDTKRTETAKRIANLGRLYVAEVSRHMK